MLNTVWVLLMMTVYMGESVTEMLGHFPTQQQCLAALNAEAAKRGPLPHAQGGGSFFQCSSWQFDTR
jgi:hypothetical protein